MVVYSNVIPTLRFPFGRVPLDVPFSDVSSRYYSNNNNDYVQCDTSPNRECRPFAGARHSLLSRSAVPIVFLVLYHNDSSMTAARTRKRNPVGLAHTDTRVTERITNGVIRRNPGTSSSPIIYLYFTDLVPFFIIFLTWTRTIRICIQARIEHRISQQRQRYFNRHTT